MRPGGYTLVEFLVVISILAIMSVVGFVYFKDFVAEQVAVKAAGQVQTLFRLAQSNATSSTLCQSKGADSWSLKFLSDAKTIELRCDPLDYLQRSYVLDSEAEISSISGDYSSTCTDTYAKLTYNVGLGSLTFAGSNTNTCFGNSNSLTFTIRNKNNITYSRNITVSKGGNINVQ